MQYVFEKILQNHTVIRWKADDWRCIFEEFSQIKDGPTCEWLPVVMRVPPSTVKNILNGASKNPGVVTIKMLCDGLGISVVEFFDTEEFRKLEQEIR